MSRLRLRFALCLSVGLLATAWLPAQAPAPAVTILHFNDVYEIGPVEGGRAGGLARVAHEIEALRRSAAPVITTLGGDYLSPSALGTARVDGEPLAGRQMVDVLNACGLEWATFGNHEFDVSEAQFRARLTESKFHLISSNVTDRAGLPFPGTHTTAIETVSSGGREIRIGLLGLTIDSNQKPWVAYKPPIESARAAVAALRGHVDAIVALTHLSLAGDTDLVQAVPDIDLVLGGHEHENWLIRRGAHFTPIVKADANVRSLAIVTMTFGASGTRPTVDARLEIVDGTIPALPAVEARVAQWVTTAFDAFRKDGFAPDTPVATITEPLDGREATVRNRPGRLTEIIANAIAREAHADLGVFNGGSVRIDDVVTPGPLTEYDVIRILPFGGKVLRATFDGAFLARVLDTGLGNQGSGGYLHTSAGVVRSSAGWSIAGTPLDPNKTYVVGISDFLLTGGEVNLDYLTRTNAHVHDVQELRDIRRVVIDELKAVYK